MSALGPIGDGFLSQHDAEQIDHIDLGTPPGKTCRSLEQKPRKPLQSSRSGAHRLARRICHSADAPIITQARPLIPPVSSDGHIELSIRGRRAAPARLLRVPRPPPAGATSTDTRVELHPHAARRAGMLCGTLLAMSAQGACLLPVAIQSGPPHQPMASVAVTPITLQS